MTPAQGQMMSSSRSAKVRAPRRARRGLSLPGAAFVLFGVSLSISFILDDQARERAAMNELVAARTVIDWARAADGHTFLNRVTFAAALEDNALLPVSIDQLTANPNTPSWIVDPTGSAQPLAGWSLSFGVIDHLGLPTATLSLVPPDDEPKIAPNTLVATLNRISRGIGADQSLDTSDARAALARAGIAPGQSDVVIFAHEFANIDTDRFARFARPGATAVAATDITFANNALTNVDVLATEDMTFNELDATTLTARSSRVDGNLVANLATFASVEATDASFANAAAPFSITPIVEATAANAATLRSRSGEMIATTTPLLSNSGRMLASEVEVADAANLPSLPQASTVQNLTAQTLFATATNLTALITEECPIC